MVEIDGQEFLERSHKATLSSECLAGAVHERGIPRQMAQPGKKHNAILLELFGVLVH